MMLLPAAAWVAEVRTAQGRQVPASEVPWMRVREAWIHAADFAGPLTFAGIPEDVASALTGDIAALWRRRDGIAGLTFVATDTGQRWGDGPRVITRPARRPARLDVRPRTPALLSSLMGQPGSRPAGCDRTLDEGEAACITRYPWAREPPDEASCMDATPIDRAGPVRRLHPVSRRVDLAGRDD